MNKKEDKVFFAKPYFVWLCIAAIVAALVWLPDNAGAKVANCLLYTSPSPRD